MQGIGRDLQRREAGRKRQTFYHSSIRSAQCSHHRSPVGVFPLALLVLHLCLGPLLNAPHGPLCFFVLHCHGLSTGVSSTCIYVRSRGSQCQHRPLSMHTCPRAEFVNCQALAMQWLGHTHLFLTSWSIRAGEKVGIGSSHGSGRRYAGCLGRAKEEVGKLPVKGLFDWARLCWVGYVGAGGPWTVECSPVNETAQAQVATEEATAAC